MAKRKPRKATEGNTLPAKPAPIPPGDRSKLPTAFYDQPRCPRCGHDKFRVTKTLPPEKDGSQTRYIHCRGCDLSSKIVFE